MFEDAKVMLRWLNEQEPSKSAYAIGFLVLLPIFTMIIGAFILTYNWIVSLPVSAFYSADAIVLYFGLMCCAGISWGLCKWT